MNLIHRLMLSVIPILVVISTIGAQISGTVRDASGSVLPFATIYIEGTTNGVSTNEDGRYLLRPSTSARITLVCQYLGYRTERKEVIYTGQPQTVDLTLQLDSYTAPEVVVSATGEDPAYAIIRQAIARRKYHLDKQGARSTDAYLKMRLDLNKMPKGVLKAMRADDEPSFLDIDSTGQGVVYLTESKSTYHRAAKNKWKEIMYSSRVSGFSNIFSFNTARAMDFSIYENLINLGQDVVSPIASNAMAHYRYELLGTTFDAQNRLVNVIRFEPKNAGSAASSGELHVIEDLWSVPRAEIGLAGSQMKDQAMDTLSLTYEAVEVAPDVWLDLQKNIYTRIKLFGFEVGLDYHGVFTAYELNPDWPADFFDRELIYVEPDANQRDSAYWSSERPIALTDEEAANYEKMDSLEEERNAYQDSIVRNPPKFSPLDLFSGYSRYIDGGRLEYEYSLPISSLFNTVRGFSMATHHTLSTNADSFHLPQWRLKGRADYGFSEQRLRAGLSYERWHTDPFKLTWAAEVGRHFVQYRQTPPMYDLANVVYSLLHENNYAKFYEVDVVAAQIDKRFESGWQVRPYAAFERRRALVNNSDYSWAKAEDDYESNNPLAPDDDAPAFSSNSRLLFGTEITYRFDQRYIKRPNRTTILESKLPVIKFGAQWSSNFDSDRNFIHAQIDVSDTYDWGLWGSGSWTIGGGDFFMDDPIFFTDAKHFDGNQTAFIASEDVGRSFMSAHYYRYSTTDRYAFARVHHSFEGQFLRHIPLIRALGWHMAGGANVLYTQSVEPYSEVYVGIEHIGIKFFRTLSAYVAWSFEEDRHLSTDFVLGIRFGGGERRSPRVVNTSL